MRTYCRGRPPRWPEPFVRRLAGVWPTGLGYHSRNLQHGILPGGDQLGGHVLL